MLNEDIMKKANSKKDFTFFSEIDKKSPKNKKADTDFIDIIELKRKISESIETKNQLIHRENYIKSQIDNLNANAELSLNILDQRKEQLLVENDNLRRDYESYPSVDFLEDQLFAITNILENASNDSQDIIPDHSINMRLKKIGILQPDEDCSILKVRLEDLIDQARRTIDPGPPQPLIHKGSPEEIEIRRNIQLFKVAGESATLRTKYEIEKIKLDIQKIKDEVDEYYRDLFENEYQSSENDDDLEEKVRQILIAAGGDINFFKKVGNDEATCMFEYDSKKIFVFQKYGEFYGECENCEFPLITLFKTLATFSHNA